MNTINITITTTEPLLGSCSGNPELHKEFIAAKAPNAEAAEEELHALPVDVQLEKAMTVFPRDDKGLFVWDYQIRGFLKESIGVACEIGEEISKPLTKWTYKRAVDSLLFVSPRRIYIKVDGKTLKQAPSSNTRPLRATTMQGDRVALATSEEIPAGAVLEFSVNWLSSSNAKSKLSITEDLILWALNYGKLKGLGQWRSGGWGTFSFEAK